MNQLGVSSGFPVGAVLFTVGAVLCWLGDYARMTTVESLAFEFGAPVLPITAEIERDRRDLVSLATAWRKSVITRERDLLVLAHQSRDGFDALLMVGIACLGAVCVFGHPHPLLALAYLLILLLSGLPRRTERRELILTDHVKRLRFLGGRARLLVDDEDGEREISLRFFAGNGARFKALIAEACPAAEIVEPMPGAAHL